MAMTGAREKQKLSFTIAAMLKLRVRIDPIVTDTRLIPLTALYQAKAILEIV